MTDRTKHFLIWLAVLAFIIGLLALSMFFTDYAERQNTRIPAKISTAVYPGDLTSNKSWDWICETGPGYVRYQRRWQIAGHDQFSDSIYVEVKK